MIFRRWIFPLTLAMTFSFVLQYFFTSNMIQVDHEKKQIESGQSFVAPELAKIQTPLNLSVDFKYDDHVQAQIDKVTTDLGVYEFSSKGAILKSMKFFWQNKTKLVDMFADNSECFLLGFNEKTPLYYKFIQIYDLKDSLGKAIEYQASFDGGMISKTFMMYHKTYEIDVKIAFNTGDEKRTAFYPKQVRIFFPMPILSDSSGASDLTGIVNQGKVADQIVLQNINLEKKDIFKQFWFEPKLFGFVNKFLVQVFLGSSDFGVQDEIIASRSYFKKITDKQYQAIVESDQIFQNAEFTWSFYLGPKTIFALEKVAPVLSQTVNYGWLTIIAKPMMNFLEYAKSKTGNYGIAIILLTILLKLLLLPFTLKSEHSMRKQAEFEKKRVYLQQKFAHDKSALDQAMAELIKKHGFPMFGGCFSQMLTFPVMFALNRVLLNSIELHGASFLWLPDLSASDPYYILGILIGISMLMVPMGPNPKQMAFRCAMALFIGAFTSYLASGLSIFILVNTVLSVFQTYLVNKLSKYFTGFGQLV